jgi:hypothetical protein
MKKIILFLILLIITFIVPLILNAKDISPPYTLTLGGRGGYVMPMGAQADVLKPGLNGSIFLNYNPKLINNFMIQPEFSYSGFRLKNNTDVMSSFYAFGVNASYNISLLKFLEVNTLAGGGYYFNRLVENNAVTGKASNPYIKGSLGLDFVINYNFNMNAGLSYVNYLATDEPTPVLAINAAVNYRFGKNPAERGFDRSIDIEEITISPLFSALYKFYETKPAGTVKISNISKNKEVTKLKASVMVKDFMDFPTQSKVIEVLKPGETATLDLFMLFNNKVLSVTEDTPLSANVSIDYVVSEREFKKEGTATFKLYNRNAMTWSDDKKLASFITPRDTPVKVFARTVIQQYQNDRINILNQNLQAAIQIFDALGVYGLTYVPDPKTPFTKFSESRDAVDYIQYPRETLRFRTGDCDDMTALYCSVLENIGISTALITIPGHIFMMFDSGVSKYDYREVSEERELIIEKSDHVWVPVEITLMGQPFMNAWREGAKEYNKSVTNQEEIGIYPVAGAWQEYVPVTLEEFGWEPEMPKKYDIAKLYDEDISNLVGKELNRKVDAIMAELKKAPKDEKLYNELGITYARYGKYTEAIENLKKAISLKIDYSSAYNNLGNVYYLQGDYTQALSTYKTAMEYSENPLILINMAKSCYKLGDYARAKEYYLSASSKDSKFKAKYVYLGAEAAGGEIRAAEAPRVDVMVEWYY